MNNNNNNNNFYKLIFYSINNLMEKIKYLILLYITF